MRLDDFLDCFPKISRKKTKIVFSIDEVRDQVRALTDKDIQSLLEIVEAEYCLREVRLIL